MLTSYPEQDNELALNGVVEGQIVHAVVDRTFVTSTGIRWVVDYKSSQCPVGLGLDAFLVGEVGKYRQQLYQYHVLLSALNPEQKVCCGLYFPYHDRWMEVET